MKKLGEKVYLYRKRKGLTRKQLGANLCDESTIFRLEKNKQLPRLDILDEISNRLDIPLSNLLCSQDEEFVRMKNRCRELICYKDYDALKAEADEFLSLLNSRELDSSSKKDLLFYYKWLNAIILHKRDLKLDESLHLFEQLNDQLKQTNELFIDSLNSYGLLLIDLNQDQKSMIIMDRAFQLLLSLPIIEDFTLYPRVGYNLAFVLFRCSKYDECLEVSYSILYYLKANQLIYCLGEIYFLIGKTLCQKNLHRDAFYYFQKAYITFLLNEDIENSKLVEKEREKTFSFLEE